MNTKIQNDPTLTVKPLATPPAPDNKVKDAPFINVIPGIENAPAHSPSDTKVRQAPPNPNDMSDAALAKKAKKANK